MALFGGVGGEKAFQFVLQRGRGDNLQDLCLSGMSGHIVHVGPVGCNVRPIRFEDTIPAIKALATHFSIDFRLRSFPYQWLLRLINCFVISLLFFYSNPRCFAPIAL